MKVNSFQQFSKIKVSIQNRTFNKITSISEYFIPLISTGTSLKQKKKALFREMYLRKFLARAHILYI